MNTDHNYDRTPAEWADLEAVGWDLLVDCALHPYEHITVYSKMNQDLAEHTGQLPWDFRLSRDRAAMGELLGRLSDRSYAESEAAGEEPVMISALCMYQHKEDVAPGFYNKAIDLDLLQPGTSPEARYFFWAEQLVKVLAWALKRESAVGNR
jgi:hypothetical protein